MSKSKYFFMNGQKYFINSELTILEIVKYFNYNASLLVLEYNSTICKKENYFRSANPTASVTSASPTSHTLSSSVIQTRSYLKYVTTRSAATTPARQRNWRVSYIPMTTLKSIWTIHFKCNTTCKRIKWIESSALVYSCAKFSRFHTTLT